MKEDLKFEIPELQLKGNYKIQLFDNETNELVQEVEKHNVISKIPFSTAFFNHIYSGFLFNRDSYGMIAGDPNDNRNWRTGYINWLMLTNDVEAPAEDYKNPVVLGDTVGYARYDDSSTHTDAKQGNFNANETTLKYNYEGTDKKTVTKHIVWDFPTDKANGTFDNIYLVPNPNYSSSNPNDDRGANYTFASFGFSSQGTAPLTNTYDRFCSDCGPISHSETHLYMQCLFLRNPNSGYIQNWNTIAKFDLKKWSTEYITLSVPTDHANKPAYIYYACGMLWRIEKDYTTTRYALDGTYKDTINLKSKFTNANALDLYCDSSNRYMGNSTSFSNSGMGWYDLFTGNDDYLFASYKLKKTENNNNMYYHYICLIDINGSVVNEVFLSKNTNTYGCANLCTGYINNEPYVFSMGDNYKSQAAFRLQNGKLVKTSSDVLKTLTRGVPFFYSKDGILYTIGTKESLSSIYLKTLIPWSSHCKLDSPVTKTATNTMKIQYDITLDYIMPGMITNLN